MGSNLGAAVVDQAPGEATAPRSEAIERIAVKAPSAVRETAAARPERAEAVLAQVRTVIRPGLRRAEVELFPRELGRVQVRLDVQRGEVAAVLRVESPEAMAALQQGSAELRAAFERAALTVSDIRYELADPGSDPRRHSDSRRSPSRPSPSRSVSSVRTGTVSVPLPTHRPATAEAGIDTLA